MKLQNNSYRVSLIVAQSSIPICFNSNGGSNFCEDWQPPSFEKNWQLYFSRKQWSLLFRKRPSCTQYLGIHLYDFDELYDTSFPVYSMKSLPLSHYSILFTEKECPISVVIVQTCYYGNMFTDTPVLYYEMLTAYQTQFCIVSIYDRSTGFTHVFRVSDYAIERFAYSVLLWTNDGGVVWYIFLFLQIF